MCAIYYSFSLAEGRMPLPIPRVRSYAMLVREQSKILASAHRRPCCRNIFAASDGPGQMQSACGRRCASAVDESRRGGQEQCDERNLRRLCEQILELLVERLRVPQVLRLAALRERTLLLSRRTGITTIRRATIEKRVQYSIARMLLYFAKNFCTH